MHSYFHSIAEDQPYNNDENVFEKLNTNIFLNIIISLVILQNRYFAITWQQQFND